MTLNVNKCHVTRFSRRKKQEEPRYLVNDTPLVHKKCAKYLGIMFGNTLDWGEHVNSVVGRAMKNLHFVMRNLKGTSSQVKEKAYTTLIRPILEYGAGIWDPHKKGQIKSLEAVQRKAARRVSGKVKWRKWENSEMVPESVTQMIEKLGWVSLQERRRVSRLCNLYRAMSGHEAWQSPADRLLKPTYYGRKDHKYKVRPRAARTDVGLYSPLNRAIRDWNGLDNKVVNNLLGTKDFRYRLSIY